MCRRSVAKLLPLTFILLIAALRSSAQQSQNPLTGQKLAPKGTRAVQLKSRQDTYVITGHTVVPSGSTLPDENDYTITHGNDVLKVRYSDSQTSTGSLRAGNLQTYQHSASATDANHAPDVSQVPIGAPIPACLLDKKPDKDGNSIIDDTHGPRPCITRARLGLHYLASRNDVYAYINFDVLSESAATPSKAARAQPGSPRKDIPAIAKSAEGAIVSIVMSDKDGQPVAQGSGFLVSKDGLIVTNYHVIAEGSSAIIKLPDGAFYVVDGVLASDKTRDIAVIKAHGQNFRTLTLGNSDRVQVGEEVVAIGNPLSLESTVSNGIVSAMRAVKEEGGDFLQITAPISPGSSGGPLFNMAGEVIGITTMYLKGGENLNFAIPANDAKPLLELDSAKLQDFPNETDSTKRQKQNHAENSSPSGPIPAAEIPVTARDYYYQLFGAGGFSGDLPSYICFGDDPRSTTFFTFRAYAYDADYYNAQAQLPTFQEKMASGSDIITPEEQKQFDIMEARQRTAPYVTFLMKGWLESFSPAAQQFFRSGGRILEENVYDKGVKTNTLEYQWNGSSWFLTIPPLDPKAYSRTSKVLGLSIEPSTMRYADSASVTITVGWGDTAATDTGGYGSWGGVCERVPNPK
ncbi:MAG: trypsin-like peptidase domain-containing protein [Candidatus Acidiferrales bacterium]